MARPEPSRTLHKPAVSFVVIEANKDYRNIGSIVIVKTQETLEFST
jgi:hypothetical protein